MKRLLLLASAALAIGIAIATPLGASATTQERFSIAGWGADAVFATCESLPPPGQVCSVTRIGVSSQITRADGSKSSETTLSIGISTYTTDPTTGMYLSISEAAGFGVPVWSIDPRLTRATATASFPVFTCTVDGCVDGTITVVASWTGQGDLLHDVTNLHVSKGPFSANFHHNGITRAASASATINGSDQGASLFADMFNIKTGDVVICHMC